MLNTDQYALDAAKEITIARVADAKGLTIDEEGGKFVAEFYEAIYNKIRALAIAADEV